MSFFEQQDAARRRTRWLIVLFVLAVICIVAAIDAAVLVAAGVARAQDGVAPAWPEVITHNTRLLAVATAATVAVIAGASLIRILRLRSGGGEVARSLGGERVNQDAENPLHRRLINVVEEIALASGVPVPEIYVLEKEDAINAFAAGFSPADAAVAVTRGALEKLNRNELQGVIAHEFSHILNGDMRLNIRLMGVLFGILVLAVAGRRVLMHTRHVGGSRNKGGGGILFVAFALMIVGYVGLFFGRWIKAGVSRSREYLADASAVQFTRDPDSIGGALKKIAVYGEGSYLAADTEEVGHMLFGAGRAQRLFATHPPLQDRILRIDPGFRREDLQQLAQRIRRERERAVEEAERARREAPDLGDALDPAGIMDRIGNPGWERMIAAAAIIAALPAPVNRAARSIDWAVEAVLTSLLDDDPEVREQQLLTISRELGSESEQRVRSLLKASMRVSSEQRLPLLELALPQVKRRSREKQTRLLRVIEALSAADGRVDPFEYLLGRLVRQYLWEAENPRRAAPAGGASLADLAAEARTVLATLARHGGGDEPDRARALRSGLEHAGIENGQGVVGDDWTQALDRALDRLDRLAPPQKETLVAAMLRTVTADEVVSPAELELLRAACAGLHVPIPLLTGPAAPAQA